MAGPKIYHSHIPDALIPNDLSFHQFLLRYNPDDAPDDKVIFEDFSPPKKQLTYGGLRQAAAVAAGTITRRYGLKEGDSVAVVGANSVNWALLAHAVIWFGGICVGTNHLATKYELEHYLALAEPSLVVVDESCRSKVEDALKAIKAFRPDRILPLDETTPERSFSTTFLQGGQPIPPLDLTGRHSHEVAACVLFSSGTTGKPKAVHLSHYNIIANLWTYRGGAPHFNNASMVEVFFPPFAHMLGLVTVVMATAFTGSYVLIIKQFNFKEWIRACASKRATLAKIVPSIAVAIVKDPEVKTLDLTSLRYIVCTGSSLQVETVNALVRLMDGVDIVQGYGLSEGTISRLHPSRAVEKAGSVGTLFPNVQLRLVDDALNDVPVGTPGEALVKAPTVFMHYRKNPQATKESFHDGWLRTGDTLTIDKDDHLWFLDRKKEMIKYKGLQVAPAELEDVLQSHKDVLEAAVTATWDDNQRTEIPIGYVVLQPEVQEAERQRVLNDIQKYVDTRVSSYKRLRGGLHAIEKLPKNATGKTLRKSLPVHVEAARRAAAKSPKPNL